MNKSSLILAAVVLAGCGAGGDGDAGTSGTGGDVVEGLGIPSGAYAVDPSHTYVTFSYLHQGLSYPLLRATEIDGELRLDVEEMANSRADIAVRADLGVRTNTSYFDAELASPKFFNAGKYPHITFTTDNYEVISDTTGKLAGRITVRGITKPLTLDVTINGAMEHPMAKKSVIGVTASGQLNRSDFGLDRFIPAVADRVHIAIEAEFMAGTSEASSAAVAAAQATATSE